MPVCYRIIRHASLRPRISSSPSFILLRPLSNESSIQLHTSKAELLSSLLPIDGISLEEIEGSGGVVRPRGAVGGCSTPGSRVDPWWNPGPLFPSTPGPPRIDEEPPDNGRGYQICGLPNRNSNSNNGSSNSSSNSSSINSSPHIQTQQVEQGPIGSRNCTNSPTSLGHVDSIARHPNVVNSGCNSNTSNLVLSALLAPTSSSNPNDDLTLLNLTSGHSNVLSSLLASAPSSAATPIATSSSRSLHSASNSSSPDSLNGILSSLNVKVKTEQTSRIRTDERRSATASLSSASSASSSSLSTSSTSNFNASLLSSLLSTSRISSNCGNDDDEDLLSRSGIKLDYSPSDESRQNQADQQGQGRLRGIKVDNSISNLATTELRQEPWSRTSSCLRRPTL
ncbi:uncharacterized protein [Prorops nasuta]|uniref:uncharacterized protein n=1 Tax=Prorops nasuta TaxID=863751 RepID=UPI0034CE7400